LDRRCSPSTGDAREPKTPRSTIWGLGLRGCTSRVTIGCANCKACSAGGPIAVGSRDEPCVEKRGPFWNPCTRARSNLATPLLCQSGIRPQKSEFGGVNKSVILVSTGRSREESASAQQRQITVVGRSDKADVTSSPNASRGRHIGFLNRIGNVTRSFAAEDDICRLRRRHRVDRRCHGNRSRCGPSVRPQTQFQFFLKSRNRLTAVVLRYCYASPSIVSTILRLFTRTPVARLLTP